jgi:site-specific recombinase XerD
MSRRLPSLLTLPEIAALLIAARDAADNARTPIKRTCAWRDFVMIQLALLAGPRVAELCDMSVEDVDLVGAVLSIKLGKGSKDRNIPIGGRLLVMLREWIGERMTGWLFPGPLGKKLLPRTFQRRLIALARAARITKRVHPHLMRHVFACSLLRTGTDIREVQELLGHASLSTTAIYLHVDTSRLKGAVDRL